MEELYGKAWRCTMKKEYEFCDYKDDDEDRDIENGGASQPNRYGRSVMIDKMIY